MNINKEDTLNRFKNTLNEISNQITINSQSIDYKSILSLIELILSTLREKNRVFVYGAGRSGFIGRCFAQRLMHFNIKSCFISDAVTYRYTSKDLLIIISGSGETTSSVAIAQKAQKIGGKKVLITGNLNSTIGNLSDLVINIKGKSKEKATSVNTLAPYTSLFDVSTLSILDSIGAVLMNILNLDETFIDKSHASLE